jgi:hypothetical protein
MSEENTATTFENKCNIIAELWMDYRDQSDLKDFVEYNDLGLPLGFLLSENLVTPTKRALDMVDETFELLLASLGVEEDTGFETFDDLMLG